MKEAMRLKAQIKAMSLQVRIPANAVLQNYMLERLLERISLSPLRDKIIIKGGLWTGRVPGTCRSNERWHGDRKCRDYCEVRGACDYAQSLKAKEREAA